MAQITYRDALRQALHDAMAEDESIVILGEDVGAYGGAYGVTKDLIKKFGAERVIDTPISEAAIVGVAVGAAMTGLRPVAELMYVDFLGLAMDQLATKRRRSGTCSAARSAYRWCCALKVALGDRQAHSTRKAWRHG